MNKDYKNELINNCKKFASKNTLCLYLAVVYIFIAILTINVYSHFKYYIFRFAAFAMAVLCFINLTSFSPMKYGDLDYKMVLEDEYIPIEQELPEDEYIRTSVTEDADRASLDDILSERDSGNTVSSSVDNALTFSKNDWKLVLINKQHSIPENYVFSLGTIKGSMQCDERIIPELTEMFAAAQKDGINLVVCSPYRDISRQEYLFDRKVKTYINNGYSYMDAYKMASTAVTVPGTSEHQIGISLDIICDNYYSLDEDFEKTDAGIWLKKNSYKYGFILRYPKDKENITGIMYEPWHYRYVGKDAAKIIWENNYTLEEFIETL